MGRCVCGAVVLTALDKNSSRGGVDGRDVLTGNIVNSSCFLLAWPRNMWLTAHLLLAD